MRKFLRWLLVQKEIFCQSASERGKRIYRNASRHVIHVQQSNGPKRNATDLISGTESFCSSFDGKRITLISWVVVVGGSVIVIVPVVLMMMVNNVDEHDNHEEEVEEK